MTQRVFITGASSGIGAALAQRYAEQGAVLGLVARRLHVLEQLRANLPNPDQHRIYALDVTDHAALASAAEDFMTALGGADIVIANAGISHGALTEYPEDLPVFEHIIATNVVATAATFTPFVATLKKRGQHCRLVSIASVAGIRGLPGAGAYSASKAAVATYCEALRVELRGSGMQVITIAPGYIDTPMTRGNPYPMPFLMPVEKFAARAVKVIDAGVSYIVIPWQMGVVAKLLRIVPDWLFDMLSAKALRKPRGEMQRESQG